MTRERHPAGPQHHDAESDVCGPAANHARRWSWRRRWRLGCDLVSPGEICQPEETAPAQPLQNCHPALRMGVEFNLPGMGILALVFDLGIVLKIYSGKIELT